MIQPFRPDDIKPIKPSTLDIETASNGDVLAIGFAYLNIFNVVEYHTYHTWAAFITHLIKLVKQHRQNKEMRRRLTTIYAHNGAGFDWLSLIIHLVDNDAIKDLKYIMSESFGIGVSITLHNKIRIRLCDSYRLLPGSLDNITRQLGTTNKLDVPERYKSKMEVFLKDNPTAFYEYLRIDVIALQDALFTFWTMIYELDGSIGYLPMTLPALALKLFRKMLEDEQYIYTPWNKEVCDFTRRAYTGGRVECYRPGVHDNVRVYDVNSMYPSVMAVCDVPTSHRCGWTRRYKDSDIGFIEVEYNQIDTTKPPLLRDETTKDFAYTGSGVYTIQEIALLTHELQGTVTVKRCLIFQHHAPLFREFVDKYYNLRMQAQESNNEAVSFICKILLNSLYGKFGQNGQSTSIELFNHARIREHIDAHKKVRILGDFAAVSDEIEVEHEFVAIAAYITSYARIELYKHIQRAGDAYIYSDTDSVHVTNTILPESRGLGGLKLEDEGTGAYTGKKLYAIRGTKGDKIKAKGIGRKTTSKPIDYDVMSDLASGAQKHFTVEFQSAPTIREVLARTAVPCKFLSRKRTISAPT